MLQSEYRRKLAKYDQKYHGTGPGQSGPLVQRLDGYGKLWGLVVGPWGDGSKDLHTLVSVVGNRHSGGYDANWNVYVVGSNSVQVRKHAY